MWIRRLEVEHWRGLERVVLDDLSPHLNLVTGPNESGKSRLVQALRFGLFESSRGSGRFKQDLNTWGANERPRVQVEFELAGALWQVEKTFGTQQYRTRLTTTNRSLEGEEAEVALRELLGTEPGSTTAPAAGAQLGRWSLLWVEQGSAGEEPGIADNSALQGSLHDRLTREVGDVAAGAVGQYVRSRAREEAERFYSQGAGAEKKLLREARSELEVRTAARSELEQRIEAIERDAQALRRGRDVEADLTQRLHNAEEALKEARARHQATRELAHRLDTSKQALAQAEATTTARRAALERAEERVTEIAALERRRDELTRALEVAAGRELELREMLAAQRDAVVDAEQQHEALRRQRLHLQRQVQARALREQQARLAAVLEQIEEQDGIVRAARSRLAGLPELDAAALEALRQQDRQRLEARARLEGASVRVKVTARQPVEFDGKTLSADETRRFLIDRDRSFDVGAALTLHVQPGSGSLDALRDSVADLDSSLAHRLEALGIADIAEGERLLREREGQQAALQTAMQRLEELAPEGLETVRSRLDALALLLADLPTDTDDDLEGELEDIEARETAQIDAATLARSQRDASSERLQRFAEEAAKQRAELEGARRELAQLQRQQAADGDVDAARTKVAEAERTLAQAAMGLEEMEASYRAAGGDTAASDVERAENALASLRQQIADQRDLRVRLEQRLADAGAASLHEELQEAAAAEEHARADFQRLERQALAARRLFEGVESAYGAAQARLAEPVIQRIQPYLEQVLPGARAHLAEDFGLLGLQFGEAGATERFDQLSGGTREQLALLVRLGLAELLGEDEPWPLLLDDALVNTDAERIRQFQRVLFAASRRTQILLFTCHGALFDAAGADRVIALEQRSRRA